MSTARDNISTKLVRLINERDRLRFLPAAAGDEHARHAKVAHLEDQIQTLYRKMEAL